jgi:hypothetical protein
MIGFHSSLVEDYLHLLDWFPDVTSIEALDFSITFSDGQRFHSCRPDLWVLLSSDPRPILIIAERRDDASDNLTIRRLAAVQTWCSLHNHTFRYVTGSDVRTGHRLANVKLLRRFADYDPSPTLIAKLYSLLLSPSCVFTVAALAAALAPEYTTGVRVVFALAYQHRLALPVETEPICGDTFVRLHTT